MIPTDAIADLSHLPQYPALQALITTLQQREEVAAIWLGGSMARGAVDGYSDLDLRVAVTPESLGEWRQRDLQSLFRGRVIAGTQLSFGPDVTFYHLILAEGTIVDLLIQSTEKPAYEEPLRVLFSRDESLSRRLAEPVLSSEPDEPLLTAGTMQDVLTRFWIDTHKHRKVLHRGLDLLALTGIHLERAVLQRLWYALATGHDYGVGRQVSIHGLSHFVRTVTQARGPEALEVIGAPTRNREEVVRAIELVRDAVSSAGRALAERLEFEYPAALEAKVRQDWEAFLMV